MNAFSSWRKGCVLESKSWNSGNKSVTDLKCCPWDTMSCLSNQKIVENFLYCPQQITLLFLPTRPEAPIGQKFLNFETEKNHLEDKLKTLMGPSSFWLQIWMLLCCWPVPWQTVGAHQHPLVHGISAVAIVRWLPSPSPGVFPDQTCASCISRWIPYYLSHQGSRFWSGA